MAPLFQKELVNVPVQLLYTRRKLFEKILANAAKRKAENLMQATGDRLKATPAAFQFGSQIGKQASDNPVDAHGSSYVPLMGGAISAAVKPHPSLGMLSNLLGEGWAGLRGGTIGSLAGGVGGAVTDAATKFKGRGVPTLLGALLGGSLGTHIGAQRHRENIPVNARSMAELMLSKKAGLFPAPRGAGEFLDAIVPKANGLRRYLQLLTFDRFRKLNQAAGYARGLVPAHEIDDVVMPELLKSVGTAGGTGVAGYTGLKQLLSSPKQPEPAPIAGKSAGAFSHALDHLGTHLVNVPKNLGGMIEGRLNRFGQLLSGSGVRHLENKAQVAKDMLVRGLGNDMHHKGLGIDYDKVFRSAERHFQHKLAPRAVYDPHTALERASDFVDDVSHSIEWAHRDAQQAVKAEKLKSLLARGGTGASALGGAAYALSGSNKQSAAKSAALTEGLAAGMGGAMSGGLAGLGVGGLYGLLSGAIQARKGKRLRGALGGALRGAGGGGLIGAGIGGGLGLGGGLPMPRVITANPAEQAASAVSLANNPTGHAAKMTVGALAGGVGGGLLANKVRKNVIPDKKENDGKEDESADE